MSSNQYPIPVRLNLAIFGAVVVLLVSLLYLAGQVSVGWPLVGVAIGYGLVMTTGHSLLHEATHAILHPNRRTNDTLGRILGLFFPASFSLLRVGHVGHHMRNRSDDEAFDYYFEGDNRVWKFLVLYGTMTGCFWVVVFLTNFFAILWPRMFEPRSGVFDRPTEAFLQAFNPAYLRAIRVEAGLAIALHLALIVGFGIPIVNWLVTLFGFGFLWSASQYVHHYGTERHVQRGAKNLRTLRVIDWLWLNHNWHLNHHMRPTVPWIYLPRLYAEEGAYRRTGLIRAYLAMWRGPRKATERVANRYAGRIIK